MALASDPLPELARITLQCSMLPWLLTVWTGSPGLSAGTVLGWTIIISEGFGVNSPFPYANPNDEFDGRRIINAVFPIYIIAFALLGTLTLFLLDLPAFCHIFSLFPAKYTKGIPKQSKLMFIIALIWILVITLGTYLTYKILLDNNQNLVAIIWINVFPAFMFLVGFLIFRYWPTMFRYYKDMMHSIVNASKCGDKEHVLHKRYMVYTMIAYFVILGLILILSNFIVSIILYFQYNVNWTALSIPFLFIIILIIAVVGMWLKNMIWRRLNVEKYNKSAEKEKMQT